jgi:hypothetical protein
LTRCILTSRVSLDPNIIVILRILAIIDRKIGFVNSLTGKMKMFVHENNEIMYEADFTCDALKSDEHERKHRPDRVMKQIYGKKLGFAC